MKYNNSATQLKGKAILSRDSGFLWGSLGVLAFSFTVPMTRLAVENNGLSPLFVGTARAVVAALLAICALSMTKQRMPRKKELLSVSIVALGAVIGFPMLTSYALTTTPASHGAVVIAILPATTAVIAALRTRTYPAGVFWIATGCGAVAAVIFSFSQGATFGALSKNDLFLLAAVVLCAISYAEGGVVSQSLGSWQTISWALIAALPVMLPLAMYSSAHADFNATGSQWCAFAYLCVVSMYLGFFAWYRGLAIGPMPQISQIQLAQPVLSILWSALFLSERITFRSVCAAIIIISCSLIAIRSKNRDFVQADVIVEQEGEQEN